MERSNFPLPESIALIGYGYWGKKLYKYLKNNPRFKLAGVYFPSLKKHEASVIHSTWGAEFTADLDRIWRDASIPNVVIATPISTHYDVAKTALSCGKNVLVEKPITLNAKQSEELAQLASNHQLALETEYTYTYSKALEQARTFVNQGLIGSLRSIHISFQQLGRFLTYDVFLLLGSHALSILDFFVPLQELTLEATPLLKVDHVTTGALIRFTAKTSLACSGYIDINLHSPKKSKRVVLYGERGTIIYDPNEKDSLHVTRYHPHQTQTGETDIQEVKNYSFDEKDNLQFAMDHFYDVVKGKTPSNIKRTILINQVLDALRKQS